MISNLITVGVETVAAIDRHYTKKKILDLAHKRHNEHLKNNNKKTFVIVKSPLDINQLKKFKSDSCVIFVDCALELCDTEEDLKNFWNELKRVSGTSDFVCTNLFVFHIQHWSSTRLFVDPKVRWIIVEAPPTEVVTKGNFFQVSKRKMVGDLEYKKYGKRNTILSDVRLRDRK